MDRLGIKKDFLVGCMKSVLYETLTEFFFSIGKSKHHIRQFESSSSEQEEEAASDHNMFNEFDYPDRRSRYQKDDCYSG